MAAEVEAVPKTEEQSHVMREEDGLTTYPAALATHEAVCEDQQLFTRLLQDLNAKLQTAQPKKYRPSKYRVPTVAGRELDLQALYRIVTGMGGAIAVTAENKWPDVIVPFQFTAKVNLSAIRKIYSSLLWHFEQVYQHTAIGQKLLEPPEMAPSPVDHAAIADGLSTRPSRNRRGTNLAAMIAADILDSDAEDEDNTDIGNGSVAGTEQKIAARGKDTSVAATGSRDTGRKAAAGSKDCTPEGAAVALKREDAAADANGSASKQQRKAHQQQQISAQQLQQRGLVPAPAKTPELVGFLKSGKGRKDLTGHSVNGRVDAKFDCGYFVSLTIAGQSFSGILYCPTAVAAAAAAGAVNQGCRSASIKAGDGAVGRPMLANGATVKREAAGAGFDSVDGGRNAKRRRSQGPAELVAKPKSAKTAFNFFAAEQWPLVKVELGPNAVPQEISRAVGEKWNRTSEADRAPYMEKSLQDKSRFERQMATWRQSLAGPVEGDAAADAAEEVAAGSVPATPTNAAAAAAEGQDSQAAEALVVAAACEGDAATAVKAPSAAHEAAAAGTAAEAEDSVADAMDVDAAVVAPAEPAIVPPPAAAGLQGGQQQYSGIVLNLEPPAYTSQQLTGVPPPAAAGAATIPFAVPAMADPQVAQHITIAGIQPDLALMQQASALQPGLLQEDVARDAAAIPGTDQTVAQQAALAPGFA